MICKAVVFAGGINLGTATVAAFVLDGGCINSGVAFCAAKNGVLGVLSLAGGAGSLGEVGREVGETEAELDDEMS